MNINSKFETSPRVMSRTIGEETVILDLESGCCFGLDPIGARIWALIERGNSLAKTCDMMVQEFDVAREKLEIDALALAQEMSDKKLINIK